MKVAIVHDWLTNMGGAEQCIINLHKCFPDAPIYTTFYDPNNMDPIFKEMNIITSSLQKKKNKKYNHKKYYPLMPMEFEKFNLNEYDVVISSSSSCAKGVITKPGSIHICYCHTPMRYAWEKRDEYMKEMSKFKKKLVRILLHYMRIWDVVSSDRVDYFIANSNETRKRIQKHYKREAYVINPPVRCDLFNISENSKNYYFVMSRLVEYKRFDLAVQACKELNRELVVIGDGPERKKLEKMAEGASNITFLGRQPDDVAKKFMSEAKALLFPGEEDFGIVPVEAESCGVPVIGYGKGGILDTVIDGKTGVLFEEQTVESLKNAMLNFEKMTFDKKQIREHALKFSEEEYRRKIKNFVEKAVEEEK